MGERFLKLAKNLKKNDAHQLYLYLNYGTIGNACNHNTIRIYQILMVVQ